MLQKCYAFTSYTSRKQMDEEILASVKEICMQSFKKIVSSVVVRKAAKVWQAETNSIEARNGAIPSVGFISSRSRSWNKRSARRADTDKTSKKACVQMELFILNQLCALIECPKWRKRLTLWASWVFVCTHSIYKHVSEHPKSFKEANREYLRQNGTNKRQLKMCNVTTPCSIKKTLGVGLERRQRAHYLTIYHVSDSKGIWTFCNCSLFIISIVSHLNSLLNMNTQNLHVMLPETWRILK